MRTSLRQRQVGSRPAVAQGFRESTAYLVGTHRALVNGSAASFRRSLQVGVPRTIKSMRWSHPAPGPACARRAITKLHIRGGLGALRTSISARSAASPAAEFHCGFAPFRCNNRHNGES